MRCTNNKMFAMKNLKNLTIILLAAAIISVMLQGCGVNVFGEKISEGVITYRLEYPDGENNNSLVMMLPPQMTMVFKDNNTLMSIKGFAGCFVLNTIANNAKKQNYTMLSVGFDQKYMLVSDFGDAPFGTNSMSDMEITTTADTMTICGYLCNKATGHSKQCNRDFTFWYTKGININSDCILSPVKSIDGVLMAFDVEMMGIYMKAKAVEVTRADIASDVFEKPGGFKEVTRTELENVIHSFDGSSKKD